MLQTLDHGPVRELRLDRPPANALTGELLAGLAAAVRSAPDDGARALVLSGRPGMFSAGLDVPHFLELDRAGTARAWSALFDAMGALVGSPIPVAGALTGHAPAGGCVLALCCDLRILADGPYRIGLNEVQVGVRIPRPIHEVAVHVVGRRQAERLCTSAELLPGEEALRVGLVDELAPVDEVVPRAVAWAEGTLRLPPRALESTRALIRGPLVRALEAVDEDGLELFLDEWFAEECQGALRALVERLASR